MIHIVMGVAGSGKTTLGRRLAQALGLAFIEGDDFHPLENRTKMSAGVPLSDADREGWITALRREIQSTDQNCVLACSALNTKVRDWLTAGWDDNCVFLHLQGARELIRGRLEARSGHFMTADMLDSQFEALEPPADAIALSIELSEDALCAAALEELQRHRQGQSNAKADKSDQA